MRKYNIPIDRRITESDYYKYSGYLNILETAPPNGACIHNTKQLITVLRLSLEIGMILPNGSENRIKELIHRLYPVII